MRVRSWWRTVNRIANRVFCFTHLLEAYSAPSRILDEPGDIARARGAGWMVRVEEKLDDGEVVGDVRTGAAQAVVLSHVWGRRRRCGLWHILAGFKDSDLQQIIGVTIDRSWSG